MDTLHASATPSVGSSPYLASTPSFTRPRDVPIQFPPNGDYVLKMVARGLSKPIYLTHAGDKSGRLFVVEQVGHVKVIVDDRVLSKPFFDIRAQVSIRAPEQGLLGLAFHPEYASNGLFFVHYSDKEGSTVVSRWQVSEDLNRADHGSEQIVLTHGQPYSNHNGGQIAFGPDGYLYIGLGDGGSRGDPGDNAQNPLTWLGAILRIDVDSDARYKVPPDNPILSSEHPRSEVWLYGLRNPWRFSFDRLTGDLYIGDVGQDQWEEINFLPAGNRGGTNYGWSHMEGNHCYRGICDGTAYSAPIAEYNQSSGDCSVTGGYVYRGRHENGLWGIYLYGDYCSGLVRGSKPGGSRRVGAHTFVTEWAAH